MEEPKKLYYPTVQPSDTQLIANDGGGVLMNNEGKFMFSSVSQEKLEELYTKQHNGNLPTNFNDVSIIGIMNQNSAPRKEIQEGNTNRTSITNPTSTATSPAPVSSNICGGSEITNKEFEEISKVISVWEELNSNNGKELKYLADNGYSKTLTLLTSLFKDPKIVDIVDNYISLDGTFFKNLDWGKYGKGESTLIKNIGVMYGDYWVTNRKNILGDPSNASYKKEFTNTLNSITSPKSVFDIQTLPSGLRTVAFSTSWKSGSSWIDRILVTVGPDYLNIPGLGITKSESDESSDKAKVDVKIKKFYDQYNQIIDTYNKNKQSFLETLVKENQDRVNRVFSKSDQEKYKKGILATKTYYEVYNNLALYIALKYKDCPNEYTLASSIQQSVPTPSPKPLTPSVEEKEEGLYEVEFAELPTNENDQEFMFNNDGVEQGGGINDGDDLLILSEGQVIDASKSGKVSGIANIVNIDLGGSRQTVGKVGGKAYTLSATGIVTDDVNNALKTCKGASNVLETAIKMNPVGYSPFNKQLPVWTYNNNNLLLQAIQNKLGCPTRYHCAAGISLSFIIFNQNDFKNKSSESGGFPVTNSSYVVPASNFTGSKVSFEKDVDWNPKTKCLTTSGIQKFEQAKKFTGGIFTIGTAGAGHIGMIYYLALEDKIDKKGNNLGKQGFYYTLEFNTAAANQTTGGQLTFRKRLIGGSWGARAGGDRYPVWFGDTSGYKGGKWAPSGLGFSNNYSFGESISFSKNILK